MDTVSEGWTLKHFYLYLRMKEGDDTFSSKYEGERYFTTRFPRFKRFNIFWKKVMGEKDFSNEILDNLCNREFDDLLSDDKEISEDNLDVLDAICDACEELNGRQEEMEGLQAIKEEKKCLEQSGHILHDKGGGYTLYSLQG